MKDLNAKLLTERFFKDDTVDFYKGSFRKLFSKTCNNIVTYRMSYIEQGNISNKSSVVVQSCEMSQSIFGVGNLSTEYKGDKVTNSVMMVDKEAKVVEFYLPNDFKLRQADCFLDFDSLNKKLFNDFLKEKSCPSLGR